MLSTDNSPSDPSQTDISSCNDISRTDEKASDEVDLLRSGLDDNNNSNPLPNFSIRDYVFSTRDKNIQTNWPFSLKNLQLCLKHGVKDVLPPFQSLDSVRNPSVVKSAVENISDSDVKLSFGLTHHIPFDSSKSNTVASISAVSSDNINTSGFEKAKEFPTTTASQSCSCTNSVPANKTPFLEPEAEILRGQSSGNLEFTVPKPNKVQTNNQTSVKKCRLFVKLGNIAEPKLNEGSGLNSSVILETMASKVCPVCKTFSSSSNTTLNAHIDQCLSGGSTVKWSAGAKVIKHRIKPRKTKLMVDIYETAIPCTLEDLDRRNGTNWSSNLGLPAPQESEACVEACVEEKNKIVSSCSIEDNEDSAVYIDSNGTKLRILSKFSDLPSSSIANDDRGPMKVVKRDNKFRKFLPCKKQKNLVRRSEFMKGAPGEQKNCLPWPDRLSEVADGEGKQFDFDGSKNDDQTVSLKSYNPSKSDDLGRIKHWVGSKRSVLKKKTSITSENLLPDTTVEIVRKNNVSPGRDTFLRGISGPNSDENSHFSVESHKRKEFSCDSDGECSQQTHPRKRVGFSLLASRECHDHKNGMSFMHKKQSTQDGPSFNKSFVDPTNGTENHGHPRIQKRVSISPLLNTDGFSTSSKVSRPHAFSSGGKMTSPHKKSNYHVPPSGAKKFSSLRKNLLSVRHESVPQSKKKLGRKHLDIKKPCLQKTSESNVVMPQAVIYRQDNLIETPSRSASLRERDSGKLSTDRTRVLRIRKNRGRFVDRRENVSSKGSPNFECDIRVVGKNMNTFKSGNVLTCTPDAVKEPDVAEPFSCDTMSAGESFIAFSRSLDSTFHGFAGPSDGERVPHTRTYEGDGPADLILCGEQEMYCSDDVGKDFVIPNKDMDGDEGRGNYFVDVDPIPIPGPPGSFLPSPGRLSSEELPGNSSLTTCKLHSSEDEHEQVDIESSDSPISTASIVSNSVSARSDSVSLVNLSVPPCDVQRKSLCGLSEEKRDLVVNSSTPFSRASSVEEDESSANVMLPNESRCSRNKGSLQTVSSSYQDSQLLCGPTMADILLPVREIQMSGENHKPHICSMGSDTLTEGTNSELEKNVTNSAMSYTPMTISRNYEAKFLTCDLESPSKSNPVLRLMGKNLMVVNKDENLSSQTRPTRSIEFTDHPGLRLHADSTLTTSHFQAENLSFHHTSSQAPIMLVENKSSIPAHPLGFTSSDGYNVIHNFRIPQCSPSTVVLPSDKSGGSFTSSHECREYGGRCSSATDQILSKISQLDSLSTWDIEKVPSPVPHRPGPSSSAKNREIIIIDDPPENEEGSGIFNSTCNESIERGGLSPYVAFGCIDPMHVNSSFSNYQIVRGYPLPNANLQMLSSGGVINASPVKWNCNSPQGSSHVLQHQHSAKAPSPATGRLGSPFYCSPGFSHLPNFTR